MDIAQAGEQIRGAVEAYLLKDSSGAYEIPFEHQRPIILMGPPGVGKTAVVAQVADQLGINFVSYSITHHTRQSALGLPYIVTRAYDGRETAVSEYTMSEIIAAVLDAREASGVAEGILFLDEVNCASETLAPAMLQFLQYKTFGQHRLPQGWTIVAAGNPPEYNRSAREFDPAMLDRMKRIDVEASLDAWMPYALTNGVHPAIIAYLEAKPADFYNVRAGVRGTRMVTARGWEDLSRIIKAYERLGRDVDAELIGQYLQDDAISSDFAAYYALFDKYHDSYRVADILDGTAPDSISARLAQAPFDERIAVVGLLGDALAQRTRDIMATEDALRLVRDDLTSLKPFVLAGGEPLAPLDELIASSDRDSVSRMAWSPSMGSKRAVMARRTTVLEGLRDDAARSLAAAGGRESGSLGELAFETMRGGFNALCSDCSRSARQDVISSDHAYDFLIGALGDGDEVLALTSRLGSDPVFVRFAGEHGGSGFLSRGEDLLVERRSDLLLDEIERLLS